MKPQLKEILEKNLLKTLPKQDVDRLLGFINKEIENSFLSGKIAGIKSVIEKK